MSSAGSGARAAAARPGRRRSGTWVPALAVGVVVALLHALVLEGVQAGVQPKSALAGSDRSAMPSLRVATALPAPSEASMPPMPKAATPSSTDEAAVAAPARDATAAARPRSAATPSTPSTPPTQAQAQARARPASLRPASTTPGSVAIAPAVLQQTALAAADDSRPAALVRPAVEVADWRQGLRLSPDPAALDPAALDPASLGAAAPAPLEPAHELEPQHPHDQDEASAPEAGVGSVQLAAAPRAGAGAASAPSPLAEPVPVYPVRVPPPFDYGYALKRGSIAGDGVIRLTIGSSGYEAQLEGRVAGMRLLDWSSRGRIDGAGLAPQRFVEARFGRSARAANFEREAAGGARITYSSSSESRPLPAGAQDRLTWMLQLAAIADARPAAVADGGQISMYVTGVRADADVWTFSVVGRETIDTPLGRIETVHLLREPRKPYDTRADVWIDPGRHHLPVRARLGSQQDDKDAFELVLQRVNPGTS